MIRRAQQKLLRQFLLHALRLMRIREGSEKVARGFALGLIVNFYPTFAFGMVISGFLARLCGGNFVAGLVGGAALTLFWPLLFALNFLTGELFVGAADVYRPGMFERGPDIKLLSGSNFWFGTIINSILAFLIFYVVTRRLLAKYRAPLLRWLVKWLKEHQRDYNQNYRLRDELLALKKRGRKARNQG